jgi:D-serine deaminase-like pyridoxal phosphate-dependent protein
LKRRSLLLGGAAALGGLGWYLRPTDHGAGHAPYFRQLSAALDAAKLAHPTLVIDKSRLLANVATLKSHIGARHAYRIVAKSLPSLPLLETVMAASGSRRLMLFHQPFINQVASRFPDADVLLGKPLPVAAAHNFYREFRGGGFDPQHQLRWLVDTPQRLAQYDALASQLGQAMRVCIEIDVGLHRGGVAHDQDLVTMLERIGQSSRLQFAGLMGYEPHVVKVPGDPLAHRDAAMARYRHYVDLTRGWFGEAWPADTVLNCGGSPTYQLYDEGDYPFDELAAGSCLVKPTDFDLPTLADHRHAAFIATPVLKALDTLELPGIPAAGQLMSAWDVNRRRTFFVYGGYWKARPESPPGLSTNPLFGRSSNQEMLNGSRNVALAADDWVFLRPAQSEFVFLQFGDIAVLEEGRIGERWPVFAAGEGANAAV